MKALILSALLILSITAGASAKTGPVDTPHSEIPSATVLAFTDTRIECDKPDAEIGPLSMQILCNGRTCCYWGEDGSWWTCSKKV